MAIRRKVKVRAEPEAEEQEEAAPETPVRRRKVVSGSVVASTNENKDSVIIRNKRRAQMSAMPKTPHAKMRNRRINDSPARTAEIWQMWCFGYSQDEIAQHFGLTRGRISQILSELRADMPKQSQEEAVELALQAYREMIRAAFKALQPGVEAGSPEHIREMRALQRHSLMMMGYDPTKPISVGDPDLRVIVEGITNEELQAALRLCPGLCGTAVKPRSLT